jgi:phosphoribosylanthranilate isomerase
MMVKICGITNRADALAAVEAGADALGFNFWTGSPRHVEPQEAARIIADLPPRVLRVGVFVDPAAAMMETVASETGIGIAQVHGTFDRAPAFVLWQALPANSAALRTAIEQSRAEAFLVDTPAGPERGGTGRSYDWALARGLPGRIILAGGLDAGNVGDAIRLAQPWGVDACSRLEIAPGKKDHTKMMEFVRAARSAQP